LHYNIHQLIYDKNTIIQKEPTPLDSPSKNIAIVIHLYYHDLWEKEIKTYLAQLSIPFDLFITVPEGRKDEEIIQLFHDQPDAHIYITENRGRDVLPFLQIMKLIGTDSYAYICKIHSKKTGDSALGNVWRQLLYYDLIGSDDVVKNIIHTFEKDDHTGVITGKNTILDSQRYTYGNDTKITQLAKQAKLIYDKHYYFAAGTMFWTRSALLKPVVDLFIAGELHFEEESGQIDDTLAHAIERFFGIIVHAEKKQIKESPSSYSKLDDATLNEVASLVLSQQYVGNNVFAMQKIKIEEQNKYISYLEDLAESMRMKNRLKTLLSDKIIPLGKKIAKIPSKLIKMLLVIKNNPSLLKKVFYYAKRGELKYLIRKIKEKSSQNITRTDMLQEVNTKEYFAEFDVSHYTLSDTPIDITVMNS